MPSATLAALEAGFTVHRLWEQPDRGAWFAAAGGTVRGMAANTLAGRIDSRAFDRLPALEIVANFGVGYDGVDAAYAAGKGVMVSNTPEVLDEEVADTTIGLLINTIRRLGLKGTELARAQCGTIRLKLLKVGAVILRNTRRIYFHLSSACPCQRLFFRVARRLSTA